ncbi:ATP-dependent RNA helicase mitochondrial precursor [Plasmodium yoelii]|uniref:ATP-dependent RNA helicase n=3 Tax=Plasmodium yoelii TaxID=5861 RepID=A0AAE9WVZ8_PLAYO|nr:ATP-dependent RNA helicase mitochondrial precursor [Plasmodium yoelii]EAA15683.1 ATP-dependent RNA helicase mss116, mitochondrial precursor [Plasmodium yoelii yoelii]WBY57767.1 ATP-dependent RNA helicase DDX51 [Plasmodium yoelii yoelii]CDU84881.1 ATP-dependent RNA helicase, putative [Plasmodium yoelii]VTZ78777.1 ATP-dependent RNA helicase DDX51, putative [Plasmodium yoelii]|eukprot:XP_724118.1 ATP-dependent RNA helicase mitochondrial precursor [Plasmodium yoelii]
MTSSIYVDNVKRLIESSYEKLVNSNLLSEAKNEIDNDIKVNQNINNEKSSKDVIKSDKKGDENNEKDSEDCDKLEDEKKVEEVRSTLSSNCRIIKIKDDEIEISKWNSLKSNPINEYIIKALINTFNFKTFLPCQSCILEYSLLYKNGSNSFLTGDIYIEVPTGLGKTLCYIITILDYFLCKKDNSFFCLILTATEELVQQILKVINKFNIPNLKCQDININKFYSNIYFDEPVHNTFENCNIIVTTTNKFELLFYSNEYLFKDLKFLIIDEVDKIVSLDKTNINSLVNSLTKIVEKNQNASNNLYRPKYFLQKYLVSATLCKVADNLMPLNLYRPIFFYYILSHARNDEFYYFTKNKNKKIYHLIALIQELPYDDRLSMLVFCNEEKTSHLLFRYLTVYFSYTNTANYKINEYNRNLSSKRKKIILNKFLSNKINILICTNSIARGLDSVNLNYVVNFDIPMHYNVLIHRIGRLSRHNSQKGTVYHFIKKSEKKIVIKSGKRRNVKNIKKLKFKKMKLKEIRSNIMEIKPLINNVISKEQLNIINQSKVYHYDDLIKLNL